MESKRRAAGRPRLGADAEETKRLPVDVPESLLTACKATARAAGLTVSAFVREAIWREILRRNRAAKAKAKRADGRRK